MERKVLKLDEYPAGLREIPKVPEKMYLVGDLPPSDSPDGEAGTIYLAVVGTRKFSGYGKDACEKIIGGLKGYDFTIVSGLALGIDAIAHRVALDAGLKTIAIPGSGLDFSVLHPRTNHRLAKEIVENGGALLSEFDWEEPAGLHTFPQRNRIIAGISRATLVVEAPERSGALITANFALDFNRDVFAVPGSIFSENSKGTNKLVKQGALAVCSADDILDAFGVAREGENLKLNFNPADFSPLENKIISALNEPTAKDDLIRKLAEPANEVNPVLSMMQLNGLIKEADGKLRRNM